MSNELTIQERAKQALAVVGTEAELHKMADKYSDITEIKDDADYKLVSSGHRALRKTIKLIEDTGMDARRDARAFADAVIQEQRRLTGIVEPVADQLKALKKDVDDAEKRRQEAIAAAEQARVDRIQARIDAILEHEKAGAHESLDVLKERDAFFGNLKFLPADFEERLEEAEQIADRVWSHVRSVLKQREAYESEQARMAEERRKLEEAQEAMRAEQARLEAERKAEEDRIRAEREKLEREKFEAQAKKEAEERARKEAQEAIERAEAERLAKEKAEEDRKAEAKRQAEEAEKRKPDIQKLRDWANRLRFDEGPTDLKDKNCEKARQTCMAGLGNLSNSILEFCDKLEKQPTRKAG